jgi:hypothetical protein
VRLVAAFLVLVVVGPRPAAAAVQPDAGNAAAWATGLATLADPPGGLAGFDQPARLFPAGTRRYAVGLARARPFGFDALARTRLGTAMTRGAVAGWLGLETFGPAGARRTRLGAGLAWRAVRAGDAGALAVGAAWHEARRDAAGDGERDTARSGALDAAVVLERRGSALALALRSLASGGSAVARADPDWTAEARLDVAPARFHLAVLHDLAATRLGGGASLAAGPLVVRAGAFGAPWTWALGLSLARSGVSLDATRAVHPRLDASDAWSAEASW